MGVLAQSCKEKLVFPSQSPHPEIPSNCHTCQNYHGKDYNGNQLICGMHPYGKDECEDWEEKVEKKTDPVLPFGMRIESPSMIEVQHCVGDSIQIDPLTEERRRHIDRLIRNRINSGMSINFNNLWIRQISSTQYELVDSND